MKMIKIILKDFLFILGLALVIGGFCYGGISLMTPRICPSGNDVVLPTTPILCLIPIMDLIFLLVFFMLYKKGKVPKRYRIYLNVLLVIYSIALYQLTIYCF